MKHTKSLALSLFCLTSSFLNAAPDDSANQKRILSVHDRQVLRRVRMTLRSSIRAGGAELRTMLSELDLHREKLSIDQRKARIAAFRLMEESARRKLMRDIVSHSRVLRESVSNDEKIKVLENLIPLLRLLPPPPRHRPTGFRQNED